MNRYRAILALPQAWVLLFVTMPARTAYGMVSLGIFFKVQRETGSIALAGLAIGCNSVAGSLTAGVRGSMMDRYGQTKPLSVLVPSYTIMLTVFSFADSRSQLLLFAFMLGISAPPINLSTRPLWKMLAPADELREAYALDTAIMNLAGIFGPILATTLALSAYPETSLYVASLFMFVGGGGLLISPVSRRWKPEKKTVDSVPLYRHPAMLLLMLEGCFIGFGWGLFDVAVPSFATLEGVPHRTAWILGIMGAANVVGGLLAGMASKHRSALRTLTNTYVLWVLVSIPIAFTYPGWSMAVAGALLGLVGGSIQVFYWEVMEATRPHGSQSAAQGWLWTVEGSLMSLGAATGGWISQSLSPRLTFGITSLCLFFGLLTLLFGKGILKNADRIPTAEEDQLAMEDNSRSTQ